MLCADCNSYSKGCWGLVVLQTTYTDDYDDARAAAAMTRLDTAIDSIITQWRAKDDPVPPHLDLEAETRLRYRMALIEDPKLYAATLSEVQAYFQTFAALYITSIEEDGSVDRTARFRAFVLLDETPLSHLEKFPIKPYADSPDVVQEALRAQWVKMVNADTDTAEKTCAVRIGHLIDHFSTLCFLDDGIK